ncbi:MAG: hypothetical protein AAGF11_55820, partial [Myxococcota bacterium]
MMTTDHARVALTTLCLTMACGPAVPEVGGGGSSGDSGTAGETGQPDPTNPNPNPTAPDPDSSTGTPPDTTTGPTTGPDTTTGEPGSQGCCEPHDSPGCNEPAVVDCVCEVEASCCAFEWDEACVELAMSDCEATCEDPGTTGEPPDTT